MDNFDPYDVFLATATNIPQLLKTGFVLQGHIYELEVDGIFADIITCLKTGNGLSCADAKIYTLSVLNNVFALHWIMLN